MNRAGLQCNVLNSNPKAPESEAYIRISGGAGLVRELFRHAYDDWTLNVHTNGHNPKSWLISLVCGIAAQFGPGATLTLHSGILPEYLRQGPAWRRTVARMACVLYERVVCVNEEIQSSIAALGIPPSQLQITPAYLPMDPPEVTITDELENWMRRHSPLICATMFFRPEYGFELFVRAMSILRRRFASLGCVVMGIGKDGAGAEAFISQLGMRDGMLLAGDLDHEVCLALMSRSSVFVRPTFRDGDSISVREAMSLGTPVVASNVGTRPAGTLLFEAGDLDGLVAQIENALGRERLREIS